MRFATFRDQLIAAPLKSCNRPRRWLTLFTFRDQLIAAPLKHRGLERGAERATDFPRSIDRGSIEADPLPVRVAETLKLSAIN